MVSIRTKTGMKKKIKRGEVISISPLYVKFPNKKISIWGYGPYLIYLESNRKARIVKDGRPIMRKGNKWIYYVK